MQVRASSPPPDAGNAPPHRLKALLLSFTTMAVLLVLGSGTVSADTIDVVSDSWPPYVFEDNGRIAGTDYETVKAVLEGMGHQLRLTFYPWKRCIAMVEDGSADALMDAGKTEQRETTLIFPKEPLSSSQTVLFHLKGRLFVFRSLADLKGLKVGTQLGYSYSVEFNQARGFIKEPVESVEINIRKLLYGRIDLFMANRNFGLFEAQRLGVSDQIAHLQKTISSGDVYLAFSRKSPKNALAAEFAKALKQFKKTERYRAILKKYGQ
jgi:polar amino acid transport system substrate-binding protein